MLLLNTEKEGLRSAAVRRALNVAIDREALVRDVLRGHGTPAHGPVWFSHWAHDPQLPKVPYAPQRVVSDKPIRFTCLVTDRSHERLALLLQRQFRQIGVQLDLQVLPVDQALEKVTRGDFDAWLADAVSGPPLIRPYWFWHSSGHLNWSRLRSQSIDAALDMIRHAPDETAYRAGVSAFHRAFMDEPPAIFLAWSERARAVSTRFNVQTEPGRDIVTNLRLWRPAAFEQTAKLN
jgi:peptide/nickel transport system substrate-binding protein